MSSHTNDSLPSANVIVTAHNEAQTIERCINALLVQRPPPKQIVVVNDGSTDDTWERLQKFADTPRIKLVNMPQNKGVPAARNIGISHCQGEIIVFTDADAYVTEGWLENLLTPFSDGAVAVTGGPDQAPLNDNSFALAVDYSLQSLIASGRLRLNNKFAPYAPAGCNLAIRRKTLEKCGSFDERLDQRGEEKELLQRIRRQGGRIQFCKNALIWHHRRVSPHQFWRQNFYSGKARVEILRLAPDAFALPHIAPAILVLTLLASLASAYTTANAIYLLPLLIYFLALLTDALLALKKTKQPAIALWVPYTSGLIHWGYGLGLCYGLLRLAIGKPVGSGRVDQAPHWERSKAN